MAIQDKTMKVHPFARSFSGKELKMSDKELKELTADIKANGVKVPILLNAKGDTILDGWTRWKIAHDNKIKLADDRFELFKGDEDAEIREIVSRNILRRHLTTDQRAMAVEMALGPIEEAKAKERQSKAGSFKGKAKLDGKGSVAEELRKVSGAGKSKQEQAAKIRKHAEKTGDTSIRDDVLAGKTSVSKGAKKVGKTKKRTKKEIPFADQVYKKWMTWLNRFAPSQRREVMSLVKEWIG
jgi:hypothetical protein